MFDWLLYYVSIYLHVCIDKQIVLGCEHSLLFFLKILESWTKDNFGSFTKSAVILKQKHLIVQFKVPNQARTILYKVRINLTYSNISKFKKKNVEVMYHSFWDTLYTVCQKNNLTVNSFDHNSKGITLLKNNKS